jgi:hypothetical protein
VAVVRVLDQRPYVQQFRGPRKLPAVRFAVLRWITSLHSYRPASFQACTAPTDPKFRDGAVYVLAFDDNFGGKTNPGQLWGRVARELPEAEALAEADALHAALKAP